MSTELIKIIIYLALALMAGFYIGLFKKEGGRMPKMPLGILFFCFLMKTSVFLFSYAGLKSTASSMDIAATIALWMGIVRIIVFFVVDYFMRTKRGLEIPTITRDFGLAVAYLIIAMIVLKQRTNVEVGSLLTTSAILTAAIGFAMQDTLGNLISGLALQMEHPYQIGDWIGFEGIEGRVVGVTWKSTKLLTRTEELIFVPNSTIAKSTLINFSRPTPKHVTFLEVGTSYNDPPHRVKNAIRETILNHPKVMKNHPPLVVVTKYDDFSVNYKAFFATEDFATEGKTRFEILNDLWYRFRREGIRIPYPIQEEWQVVPSEIRAEEEKKARKRKEAIPALLGKIDLFAALPPDVRNELAAKMAVIDFAEGETIVNQGDPPGPMYIIKDGTCSVTVSHDGGGHIEVARLKETDFFGEMSVLTGAPRTASVRAATHVTCYEVEKGDLKELFERHPALMEVMGSVLVKRQDALKDYKERTGEALKSAAVKENQLISRIKAFLRL